MFLKLTIAFIGGILMGLTPAPINAWFLAWVALIPLWVLIVKTSQFPIPNYY
jgi:apolipoprotein N-acyltransferase